MIDKSSDWSNLIREAKERLALCSSADGFETGEPEAERMLLDLDGHSHHFVLACLMDRQIKAERAWRIPYWIGFHNDRKWDFPAYEKLSLSTIQKTFLDKKLHRFNKNMPQIFFSGVQRIRQCYDGAAKNIWTGNPPGARVVRKFLEFKGAGQKIATMATNILIRTFKVSMTDKSTVDIPVDGQVLKFFKKKNLLRKDASKEELIYLAREMYPEYPGIFDLVAWEGGRKL